MTGLSDRWDISSNNRGITKRRVGFYLFKSKVNEFWWKNRTLWKVFMAVNRSFTLMHKWAQLCYSDSFYEVNVKSKSRVACVHRVAYLKLTPGVPFEEKPQLVYCSSSALLSISLKKKKKEFYPGQVNHVSNSLILTGTGIVPLKP